MFNSRINLRKAIVCLFLMLGLTAKRFCVMPSSLPPNVALSINPFSRNAAKVVAARDPKMPCASSGLAALFSCSPKTS